MIAAPKANKHDKVRDRNLSREYDRNVYARRQGVGTTPHARPSEADDVEETPHQTRVPGCVFRDMTQSDHVSTWLSLYHHKKSGGLFTKPFFRNWHDYLVIYPFSCEVRTRIEAVTKKRPSTGVGPHVPSPAYVYGDVLKRFDSVHRGVQTELLAVCLWAVATKAMKMVKTT